MIGVFLTTCLIARGAIKGAAWYYAAKRNNEHLRRLKAFGFIQKEEACIRTYSFLGEGDVVEDLVREFNNRREELGRWMMDPGLRPLARKLCAVAYGRRL